jgi:hypothetical protein
MKFALSTILVTLALAQSAFAFECVKVRDELHLANRFRESTATKMVSIYSLRNAKGSSLDTFESKNDCLRAAYKCVDRTELKAVESTNMRFSGLYFNKHVVVESKLKNVDGKVLASFASAKECSNARNSLVK